MKEGLQFLIGVDKKNPFFSVYKNNGKFKLISEKSEMQ